MIFGYSKFQIWVIIELIIISGVVVYLLHKVKKLEKKIENFNHIYEEVDKNE